MMKWIAAILMATAAISLTGCSSGNVDPSADSTSESSMTIDKPIHKAIGEKAYWACTTKSNDCPLVFSVTEISAVDKAECSSYALEQFKPTDRLIRVKIDASAQGPMPGVTPRTSAAGVLTSQFWNGVSADGYVTPAETAYGCIPNGNPSTYGPFHTQLGIGEKGRGEMVFAVPSDSTKLSLHYFNSAGWTWDLPVSA